MCCKVFAIPEIDKPRDVWCQHCNVGKGCRIYPDRPDRCRIFHCGYLLWDKVPEHWFPPKSRIVISNEDGYRLIFYVDSRQPGRWREQPYYNEIKAMAVMALSDNFQVLVSTGQRLFAVFGDRDIDLGLFGPDDLVVTGKRSDGTWGAAKVRKDDPRMAWNNQGAPLAGLIPLD